MLKFYSEVKVLSACLHEGRPKADGTKSLTQKLGVMDNAGTCETVYVYATPQVQVGQTIVLESTPKDAGFLKIASITQADVGLKPVQLQAAA